MKALIYLALAAQAITAEPRAWRALSSGHHGCEGAQWIGDTLHYAAHHDGLALKWSEATGLVFWRRDSPEATSFRPDGAGGFYVVEQTTRQLARWDAAGARKEVLADHFEGLRLNRPNDCLVHPDGSVWFTDPDFLFRQRPQEKKELNEQGVYRWQAGKGLERMATGFDKPNGIAFSPDGETLFITDSGRSELIVWQWKTDQRRVLKSFEPKGVDGLAIDAEGRLWCCGADRLWVLKLSGEVIEEIPTPSKPTSLAFGPKGQLCGTTRDACYLTSSDVGAR
jgi:gluconolactonase